MIDGVIREVKLNGSFMGGMKDCCRWKEGKRVLHKVDEGLFEMK
ncbi:hypothetical protein [Ferdinandcohnia sp. Marseille-Q9671]